MPLILALIFLKIAVSVYEFPFLQQPESTPPNRSLTTFKKYYNSNFFYRFHTLELEHLGDLNGERTSLNAYSPQMLKRWFHAIDALTSAPDLLPFLITFYYGSALNLNTLCVDFLEKHSDHNPQEKWRWLTYGYTLSQSKKQAKRLASKLSAYGKAYDLPLWIKDTEARHRHHHGDTPGARALFQVLLKDPNNTLSSEEKRFLKKIISSSRTL